MARTMTAAGTTIVGSCSGYELQTDLPFRTLRGAGDGMRLRVAAAEGPEPEGQLVGEWLPREGNPFHGRLLRTGATYAFWASDAGWFGVDPGERSITLEGGTRPLTLTREVRMFGVPASIIATAGGDISVHAAAVEIGGRAVLLAGHSRHGKTTLAAALGAAGHRVLCEDMSRCTDRGELRPRGLDHALDVDQPEILRRRLAVRSGGQLPFTRRQGHGADPARPCSRPPGGSIARHRVAARA